MKNNRSPKNAFTGWKEVFSFTMHTQTDTKAFRVSTLLIALLISAMAFCAVFFLGKTDFGTAPGHDSSIQTAGTKISTVYVLDESGLPPVDFSVLTQSNITASTYQTAAVDAADLSAAANEACSGDDNAVFLYISEAEGAYHLDFVLPFYTALSEQDMQDLSNALTNYYSQYKMSLSGISPEILTSVTSPVSTVISDIGVTEKSIGEIIINIIAPMILALIFYMMILLYGQTICKSLVTEKTSKLLETLLTSVRPAAIVAGKVLAMTLIAVVQLVLWIAGGVLGAELANRVNASSIPGYVNPVSSIISLIRENSGEFAFSLPALILALIIFVVGFLFYCTLAGLAGAMVNKMEEIGSGMAMFQVPVILSFMLAYLPRAFESGDSLKLLARFLPISAPFALPAELIIGDAPLYHGLIALAILILSFVLLLLITGKIYKGLIMISGSSISLKTITQLLKTK